MTTMTATTERAATTAPALDLEALYRDNSRGLYFLALRLTGSPDDAEDALHDAFLRAWKARARLGDGIGSPFVWLWVITKNAALAQRLYNRRRPCDPASDEDAKWASHPHRPSVEPDEVARIRRAIRQLPAQGRHAVFLHYWLGMSVTEVAAELDMTPAEASNLLRRSRERVQRVLGGGQAVRQYRQPGVPRNARHLARLRTARCARYTASVGRFVEECCRAGAGDVVTSAALRAAYVRWCGCRGEEPVGPKAFSLTLQNEHGAVIGKVSPGTRVYRGLALVDDLADVPLDERTAERLREIAGP